MGEILPIIMFYLDNDPKWKFFHSLCPPRTKFMHQDILILQEYFSLIFMQAVHVWLPTSSISSAINVTWQIKVYHDCQKWKVKVKMIDNWNCCFEKLNLSIILAGKGIDLVLRNKWRESQG